MKKPHLKVSTAGLFFAGLLVASPVIAIDELIEHNFNAPICSIASPVDENSSGIVYQACGWSIPSWAKTSSGNINIGLFKNSHGKATGNTRTATKNGTKLTIQRDYGGHRTYWKLKRSGSSGYYSVTKDGKVLRWSDGNGATIAQKNFLDINLIREIES